MHQSLTYSSSLGSWVSSCCRCERTDLYGLEAGQELQRGLVCPHSHSGIEKGGLVCDKLGGSLKKPGLPGHLACHATMSVSMDMSCSRALSWQVRLASMPALFSSRSAVDTACTRLPCVSVLYQLVQFHSCTLMSSRSHTRLVPIARMASVICRGPGMSQMKVRCTLLHSLSPRPDTQRHPAC